MLGVFVCGECFLGWGVWCLVSVQGVPPLRKDKKLWARGGRSPSFDAHGSVGVADKTLVTVMPRRCGKIAGFSQKGNVGVRGGCGGGKRGVSRGGSQGRG